MRSKAQSLCLRSLRISILRITGSDNLVAEDLLAYEIGYREQMTDKFSWDIATYYNVYQNLVALVPGQVFPEPFPPPFHLVLPLNYANAASGETYGVELACNYAVSKAWRLYAQYTLLELRTSGTSSPYAFDPNNQFYVRSSWDLRENLQFDLMFRYVDSLNQIDVPSYTSMDLRLAWRPRKNVELAVVGQNLLQSDHWEYAQAGGSGFVTAVPRSVYATMTWRY